MEEWMTASDGDELHVIPIGDLRMHEETEKCHCRPRVTDGVVVHNSFDGRELYEAGKRKH